jgi:hypothetical protein
MLRRYMHNRERHFAMLNANRVVREFGWGTEFVRKMEMAATRENFSASIQKTRSPKATNFSSRPTSKISI